ncbi:MAG: hypothetical protein LBU21_09495 [Treponema sp.]|nr:hypothetical protein [Treponema sp.]
MAIGLIAGVSSIYAEELRVVPPVVLEISRGNPVRTSIPYNGAVLISLGDDWRFFRAVELECTAPQEWLSYQGNAPGNLAVSMYADLTGLELPLDPAVPVLDIGGRPFFYEALPGKLRSVYQIPLREGHNLETSPYALVLPGHVSPDSFPILIRLSPAIQGIGELEKMDFQISARPILGEEGALRVRFRYPEHLPDRPFTVLIDDQELEAPVDTLLREGEHRLLVLSDDYRNENRLFRVERGRVLDLDIALQDPAPLLFFEAPEQALIVLDGQVVEGLRGPIPVEPGIHEVCFELSDYRIIRNIQVQRGKTYHIAITVDVDVTESD